MKQLHLRPMLKTGETLDSLRRETDSLGQQIDALRQGNSLWQVPASPSAEDPLLRQRELLAQLQALQQRFDALLRDLPSPDAERRAVILAAVERARSRRRGVRSSLVNRVKQWLGRALARMSEDEVLRAVEAQTPVETIAEILAAAPEARSGSENDWAELLLRGAAAKNRIRELVGGLLSSSEVAVVLGISVQGVKQRMERGKLLAVPLSGGQWAFPALQFANDGRVRVGVPEVARAGADYDPWTVLSILVDDAADGSGILLEHLDDPAVLRDVLHRLATYGEHVSA